jgi:hypothetical protein
LFSPSINFLLIFLSNRTNKPQECQIRL